MKWRLCRTMCYQRCETTADGSSLGTESKSDDTDGKQGEHEGGQGPNIFRRIDIEIDRWIEGFHFGSYDFNCVAWCVNLSCQSQVWRIKNNNTNSCRGRRSPWRSPIFLVCVWSGLQPFGVGDHRRILTRSSCLSHPTSVLFSASE